MAYAVNIPRTASRKSLNPILRLERSGIVQRLAGLYSGLLEETVTPRQTLHLVNAQISGFTLLLTTAAPWMFYVLELAWFVLALRGCARVLPESLKSTSDSKTASANRRNLAD